MKLSLALSIFQGMELKLSEAYFKCSLNFSSSRDDEDPEVAAFFSELADAETAHARALDSLGKRPEVAGLEIDIPQGLAEELTILIDSKVKEIKEAKSLDRALELVADLEQSELNAIFDSIVQGLAAINLAHLELTTKQHINFIQEKAAKFDLDGRVKERIDNLRVKDRDYYRLFTDG